MAGGGNAIRGSRVGAGPMGEAERGEAAPRQAVDLFLLARAPLGGDLRGRAVVPDSWDCPKCGLPASLDSENPPPAPKIEPYKTHLAYVKERRSDAEAEDPRRGDQLLRSRAEVAARSSSELGSSFADGPVVRAGSVRASGTSAAASRSRNQMVSARP